MRLIDAYDVIVTLNHLIKDSMGYLGGVDIKRVIDKVPTADTERHGHWMLHPDCKEWYICSYCGNRHIFSLDYDCRYFRWLSPYCPNCGAKMDEVEE